MLDTYVLAPGTPEAGPEILKPDIRVIESEETYGRVAVEPLQRGFGLTVGNPLRRILLSSTNGAAITWVKIDGVVHEYAAIPGVKEEVMELLLNVKRIRIRSQSDRAGKMRLDVSGEGRVCAGDISTSSDFEIVNPELHLATLDTNEAHLSIEFNVEHGVGYQAAAQSDGTTNPPVGVLPVDAVFSPVRKVNYNVERTRVGQVTDYERLVLEVWTDGTIKPLEAVQQGAENLVNHFFLFSNLNRAAEEGADRTPLVVSPEVYQTPIEKLELSPRTLNCLKRAHISKVGEVLEMPDEELMKIRNFGEKSLVELQEKLAEHGISAPADGAGRSGDVPELTAEDLGELMGGGGESPTATAVATPPGMSIEDFGAPDNAQDDDDVYDDDDYDDEEDSD
jgi:DNA-directed RNA polymerase subunit alpha